MSEITKIIPAHIIRLYAWDVLQHNTPLTLIDGIVPITALQDEPQIADAQKTYLVYGYSENSHPSLYEIVAGVVTFNIKARKFSEFGQITNALSRAFERCDISAAQMNQWAHVKSTELAVPLDNIHFTMTEVIYMDSNPEGSEGGPKTGMLSVSYECIINDNSFTLPPAAIGNLWNPV